MSMISLVATDQLLSVALQPTIATGDKNSVQLNVEFSEEWDGYARSAVFFHSIDTDMIYEMILVNGQCTVPHEVLTESGVLYIGVRGVNSGKFVKTSTLVKYKIKEGAPSGTGTTVEPTADVYQQLLSAYGDMEKYIVEEIDKVKVSGIQRTPLFANSVDECTDTDLLYVLPDGFIYAYMYFEDRIKYYTNLATTFEEGALDSQGAIVPQGDAITCTDYIPCSDEAVVRIRGFGALDDCNVIFYNQAQEVVAARQFTTDVTDTISYSYDEASETATITSNSSDITYLRVSGILTGSTDDVIITVDEVIMETVIPNYDWKSTGHSLVPADYDGRMEGLSKEIDVERKRINKIVSLPEGSTTGDAELQDIRVGADGVVYESAGEAVRRQISALLDMPTGGGGTSITITKIEESDSDEGTNVVEFSDGNVLHVKNGSKGAKGDKGDKGDKGAAGYTPQKGTDYWTPTDKAEIIASVINTLGGNPIFGYVDENNNIVVQGNLTDGTYSVKYEMENGTTVDIGELALGAKPKNFSVASEWTDNARLSISSGSTSTLAGHSTTNYIACLKGDVIQVTGLNIVGLIAPNNNDSSNAAKIVVYDSNKNKLGGLYSVASSEAQNYGAKVAVDGDISTYTILLNNEGTQIATDSARYIRVDGGLLSGYTKNDVVINIKRNGEWLTE